MHNSFSEFFSSSGSEGPDEVLSWRGVRRPSVRPSSNFQNATPPTPLDGFLSYWVTIVPRVGEVKVVLQVAPPVTTLAPAMLGLKTRKTPLLPGILTVFKTDGAKL